MIQYAESYSGEDKPTGWKRLDRNRKDLEGDPPKAARFVALYLGDKV